MIARWQQALDAAAADLGVPGAQLAVYDGETVHELATGTANVESGEAASTRTLFQIGSTTKVVNAALLMQLVENGPVELDAPIATYLPDLELPDGVQTRATPRQLLSMTSGLDNGPYTDHGDADDCVARYCAAAAHLPLIAAPGEQFGYSNVSSVIAGRIVETVTGRCWDRAVVDRLLRPAGLEHSATTQEDLRRHAVAMGYQPTPDGPRLVRPWRFPRSLAPAGSTMCMTAGDLVRFACLFLAPGLLLSAETVELMQAPQVDLPTRLIAEQWGLGPFRKRWGDTTVLGHSGTNASGSSNLVWAPAANVAAAAVVNLPGAGYPLAHRVFTDVLREFGIDVPASAAPVSVPTSPAGIPGRYSAHAIDADVTDDGGTLLLTLHSRQAADFGGPEVTIESSLEPLGDDRYLPTNPAASGGRVWDVAFVRDAHGTVTHFVNGVFALRRAG